MARPSLVERLEAAAEDASVMLIEAPAGWGKSTLLSSWQAGSQAPDRFAWLSLDAFDNEPRLFWSAMVEALDAVEPGLGQEPAQILCQRHNVLQGLVPSIVNGLSVSKRPLTLVLDDYHLIEDPVVHTGVAYLIEHLPPAARVVIACRAEPPLPFGRLRSRGELMELRLDDLRFTLPEARALLDVEPGLDLSDAEATRLWVRTEGWAAGLHLAVLSLRGQAHPGPLIDQLAGDDRFVVDYLLSEVVEGLPEDLRRFLCQTSVLDRLCGDLCDAVLGTAGSDATLEQIERDQLFLVALDNRRIWYRYHQLFADLLRRELSRSDPEGVRALHRRASTWFRSQGMFIDAVNHGLAAGDVEDVADLVGRTYLDCITEGQLNVVLDWLDQIPEAVVRSSAHACLARAQTLVFSGQVDQAERWLQAVETAPPHQGALCGHYASVTVAANHVRSTVHYFRGDVGRALEAAEEAAAAQPTGAAAEMYVASYIRGAVAYRHGDLDQARWAFSQDIARAERRRRHQLLVVGLAYAALVELQSHQLGAASALLERAREARAGTNFTHGWIGALLQLGQGRLEMLQGQVLSAERTFREAEELARAGPDRLCHVDLLVALAGAEHRLGDHGAASVHSAQAVQLLDTCPDPGVVLTRWRVQGPELRPAALRRPAGLTRRQVDVLHLVSLGLPSVEVARRLGLSERTVHAHLRVIYTKLGVTSRTAAARFAIEHDL